MLGFLVMPAFIHTLVAWLLTLFSWQVLSQQELSWGCHMAARHAMPHDAITNSW